MVPEKNGIVLYNDNGTAPGIIMEKNGKMIVMLPGPPRETIPMFQNQVKPYLAKKQEFSIDIWQVQDMYIYCDKLRVKEILVNLLGNAVKYTQTGGSISLRIIQKPCEKENFGNYEIHVKDNGCGMSEEFRQKIFEPFERQANSTISGIQGTGLGMTIIKGFVDAMGGTIDIKSEENKGTEIIVRLCQRIAEAPEKSEEQKTISCSPEFFAGKRVLLVEDNDLNREIASEIIGMTGASVEMESLSSKMR